MAKERMQKGLGGEELSPWHKVAVLMVALGEELSGELMRHFGEEEIESVTQAIADLKNISTGLQDAVLLEFEEVLNREGGTAQGGMEFARRLLEQALGPERAKEMLQRTGKGESAGFRLLRNADPEQVAPFLSQEHPQTIALILSQLEPAQAAGILEHLPGRLQAEVTHRIATLERIQPEVLEEVEKSLAAMLQDVLGGKREVGGSKVVADILNLTGASVEKGILNQIDSQDPEMAEDIRNRMLTFDDLGSLDDRAMLLVLGQVELPDLMVALRAADKGVRDRFLSSMSERRRARLLEDMEVMPAVRLSEVEEAQMRIVRQVRQLEEQGAIRISKGSEDDPYI
jgi:flagellar motor switch protein FliG